MAKKRAKKPVPKTGVKKKKRVTRPRSKKKTTPPKPPEKEVDKAEKERELIRSDLKSIEPVRLRPRRGRRPKLKQILEFSQDVYRKMLYLIEMGAYDYVAASALGIGKDTFSFWMSRGEEALSGIYRDFYEDVCRARATARITAELKVAKHNPEFWLTRGPGKTKQGQPGWTENIAIVGDDEATSVGLSGLVREDRVSHADAAQVLVLLETLNIVVPTETGRELLAQGNGNGRVTSLPGDEEEDGDETRDTGYNPEAGLDIEDVTPQLDPEFPQ